MPNLTTAEWSAVVQAFASVVAVVVAGVALVIASDARAAEKAQAKAANEALAAARESDRSRQRETQVLAVRPILPQSWNLGVQSGAWVLTVVARIEGSYPLLNVTMILRGITEEGIVYATVREMGPMLPSGVDQGIQINAGPFIRKGPGAHPFSDRWEVVLNYNGMLGQWVNEHYEFWPERSMRGDSPYFRLYRLEIEPAIDVDEKSVDLSFGDPFGDERLVPRK